MNLEEINKGLAPMMKKADRQLDLNLRAVKALESIARFFQWQQKRAVRIDQRDAREKARYKRDMARYNRQQKKGGAR